MKAKAEKSSKQKLKRKTEKQSRQLDKQKSREAKRSREAQQQRSRGKQTPQKTKTNPQEKQKSSDNEASLATKGPPQDAHDHKNFEPALMAGAEHRVEALLPKPANQRCFNSARLARSLHVLAAVAVVAARGAQKSAELDSTEFLPGGSACLCYCYDSSLTVQGWGAL